MNEDDTLRRLKRSTYEEVTKEIRQLSSIIGWGEIVEKHGWTLEELHKKWNRRLQ